MRLGKPHLEQGQEASDGESRTALRRRSRAARPSLRVDRWRLSATAVVDGWSPVAVRRDDRTRPIGRLVRSQASDLRKQVHEASPEAV